MFRSILLIGVVTFILGLYMGYSIGAKGPTTKKWDREPTVPEYVVIPPRIVEDAPEIISERWEYLDVELQNGTIASAILDVEGIIDPFCKTLTDLAIREAFLESYNVRILVKRVIDRIEEVEQSEADDDCDFVVTSSIIQVTED